MFHIKDKRQKLCSIYLRKHGGIEALRYSKKNKVIINEEKAQFNSILKLGVPAHEKCKHLDI